MIEDGTFRYHDESSSTNGPLTLERVTAVFRQELFDYRTAVSGILMEGSTPRSFDLRARIRKNIFALPDNPLTWSGELYGDLDRIRASELLKNLGLKGPLYSGIGSTRSGHLLSKAASHPLLLILRWQTFVHNLLPNSPNCVFPG